MLDYERDLELHVAKAKSGMTNTERDMAEINKTLAGWSKFPPAKQDIGGSLVGGILKIKGRIFDLEVHH